MNNDSAGRTPNRLIREKSPYLQQHAYNPVEWFPWGDEAFEKAAAEDKPVFLSIGYSTCHWCHVMERESFEHEEIAGLLNADFVCVKVDREEHPDVDQIYMAAVMAMSGQGGWPLTAFLTPDRKPFFGGTYFPPERRWNMPGMKDVLPAVVKSWKERRAELIESAGEIARAIEGGLQGGGPPGTVTEDTFHRAFQQAVAAFDAQEGGFGPAPKFPRCGELSWLLRYAARSGQADAARMVDATIDRLSRGGIHDHLGGGLHRYATDAGWLVPHFEKMLYDQALAAQAAIEAFQMSGEAASAEFARDIFRYVLRDLRSPDGAFYSAEDADSEGREGQFYVWTPEEIASVLPRDDAELCGSYYGVTAEGNFEHGTSVLHEAVPLQEFARRHGMAPAELARRLAAARAQLAEARSRRVRPHRDEKILTSWNGLMIAALAAGGRVLEDAAYVDAARAAARFLLGRLLRGGRLLRRWRDGEAKYTGTLEDYAFVLHGLIELYEAGYEASVLDSARQLAQAMVEEHWDAESGGWFMRAKSDAPLLATVKDIADNATPSGNGMAATVAIRLGRLAGDRQLESLGLRTVDVFASDMNRAPFAMPQALTAADLALGPIREVVIAGDPAESGAQALLRPLRRRFLPKTLVLLHPAQGPERQRIERVAPLVQGKEPVDGRCAAYVCEGSTCQAPVSDAEALAKMLGVGAD